MARIVGISAGRDGKVTESLVKAILDGSGEEHEFISLSGKLIRPCEGCNGCVKTNRCVLEDEFQPVLLWSFQVSSSNIEATPAVWKDMIYVGSRDGYMYAVGQKDS